MVVLVLVWVMMGGVGGGGVGVLPKFLWSDDWLIFFTLFASMTVSLMLAGGGHLGVVRVCVHVCV